MAVRLAARSLDGHERVRINRELVFRAKRRGPRQRYSAAQNKSLTAYRTDSGGWLYLPRHYGLTHFADRVIKNDRCLVTDYRYLGQLRGDQPQMADIALTELRQKGATSLNLHTGYGKTETSVKLSADLKGLTLVLCSNTVTVNQWVTAFSKKTDANVWLVKNKGKGEHIENIPAEAQVWVSMVDRVKKLPWLARMQVRTLIIDEAHLFATPERYPAILALEPEFIIIATATPKRGDGLFPAIGACVGPSDERLYKISQKPFHVIKFNTGVDVEPKLNTQGHTDFNDLMRLLSEHELRNQLIFDIVKENYEKGFKILILTRLVKHVHILRRGVGAMGIESDWLAGTKSTYRDTRLLIGTMAKIGTAFDEHMACATKVEGKLNLLLLVSSIKDPTTFEQCIGRILRADEPNVIHFVDAHRIIRRHWTPAKKWYLSRQGNIEEINSHLVVRGSRKKLLAEPSPNPVDQSPISSAKSSSSKAKSAAVSQTYDHLSSDQRPKDEGLKDEGPKDEGPKDEGPPISRAKLIVPRPSAKLVIPRSSIPRSSIPRSSIKLIIPPHSASGEHLKGSPLPVTREHLKGHSAEIQSVAQRVSQERRPVKLPRKNISDKRRQTKPTKRAVSDEWRRQQLINLRARQTTLKPNEDRSSANKTRQEPESDQ